MKKRLYIMIKTWLLDAVRNIKKRIVSWFSIVTIVLIGTTLILGLFFASSTVKKACTQYIYDQNFRDFDVTSSMGIRQEDIDRIKELDHINDAEGQIIFGGVTTFGNNSGAAAIISATERISVPSVVEGRMPTAADECIASLGAMQEIGAGIGDEIEIKISTARFADVLTNHKFKITGLAAHPDYMVKDVTDYIVLPLSAFDTSQLSFGYSNLVVDADIPQDTFKKPYKERSSELKAVLEKETDILAKERVESLANDLDKEYENARKKADEELGKGKTELDDAKKLFNDTIKEAREKLDQGELELNSLKGKAQKELSEARKKIKEGEDEYNRMVADGQLQLENAEKDMEKELENAKWQLFDGFLKIDEAEKLLGQKEEEYKEAFYILEAGKKALKEGREALDSGWGTYNEAISEIDSKLTPGVIETVASAVEVFSEEEGDGADVLSGELMEIKDFAAYDRATGILGLYDKYLGEVFSEPIKEEIDKLFGMDTFRTQLDDLGKGKEELDSKEADYSEGVKKVHDGEEALKEGRQKLDEGWFSLEQSKKKLAEGQAEFAKKEPEARKKLEDAKLEFEQKKAEGTAQLEDAKKTLNSKAAQAQETLNKLEAEFLKAKGEYNTQKADGEQKLAEAESKYEEAKAEAEKKLAEVKQQLDEAKDIPCYFVVRTRDVNFPFVQTKSYIKAIDGFFSAFTPLYSGIIAIVCFFTMTIIVEEQTSQIGTCKAFGMRESEIMRKYVVFGTSGALVGAIGGVFGAFSIEKLLINTMKSNLAFSLEGVGHNVFMIVLLPVLEVLITVVAVMWSCHRFIRCTAVGLINGSEPAAKFRKKTGFSISKRLYTNLIINNLMTDIGREVVSVVTIVLCVFIVGFGIDIKMAYEGALDKQMNEIWKYDITLTEAGNVTPEEEEGIIKALSDYDYLNLPVAAGVITDGESQVVVSMICVDDRDRFNEFYDLKNSKNALVSIPDNAVLVTQEMEDKNGLTPGSSTNLISENLKFSEIDIEGTFMLYAGKTMIMTTDYYTDKAGAAPKYNTYYIKAGKDAPDLREKLSNLPGVAQAELVKNLRNRNMSVVYLYNTVVAIVIVFSIMLSFMILLNLSNILVAHRMREILTMRVNGFSNGQVIGYLAKEVTVTVLLAVVMAVAIGMPSTSILMKNMETDAFMFVRQPYILAWAASVLINIMFSVVINLIAFRKINQVPLTDINKY